MTWHESWHDNHCTACIPSYVLHPFTKDKPKAYYCSLLLLFGWFGKSFWLNNNDHMGGQFLRMEGMTKATRGTCYEGITVQDFRSYIKRSREHEAILQCVTDVLHREFNRYRRTDGGRVRVLLVSSLSLWSNDEFSLELPWVEWINLSEYCLIKNVLLMNLPILSLLLW